jgi:cyclic pyranopterin phosphate synthase
MVSIGDKPEVRRMAIATARIRMQPATLATIRRGQISKGDVLAVARIAAISAAKSTSGLIPLCHPVRLTTVEVGFEFHDDLPGVEARVTVNAVDRTGPEMEAMTAASVAALTIYDMCKAIDRDIEIASVLLLEKAGGKSGHWVRGG